MSDTATVNRLIRDATNSMDSRPDSALALAEQALDLSRRLGFREGEAYALSRVGIASHLTGRSTGFEEMEASLDLFKSLKNDIQYAWTLVNIANLHVDQGDYVTGSERLQQALEVFTKKDFRVGMAGTMLNLGEIRMTLGQQEDAMALTRNALAMYESLDHPRGRSLALNRMAALNIGMGQPSEAIPLLNESLRIAESRRDYRTMGSVLESLGQAHDRLGDLSNALNYYRRSLEFRDLIDDRLERVGSLNGISKTLFRMGDAAQALPMAKEAYDVSIGLDLPKHTAESARLLYEIHKSMGDVATSLKYLETYQSIYSELLSAERASAIANLEAVAELRRKKDQIDLLTKQRWLERLVLASVLGLLTLMVAFLVYMHHERKRVMAMADELSRVAKQKDRILSIVSHDLRGPLASLSSVLELLDLELISPDDWKELKPSLVRQFKGTDETLQDLLVWAKGQFEGNDPRIQPQSLRDAVNMCEELLDVVARQKQVSIVNDVSADAVVMCDRSHLLAILRNLLTNAVKFSQPGQTVTVLDGITDGMRIVSVRDEGVGLSPDRRDKLFEGAGVTTKGTAGEVGSGIGLVFVRDLVQRNKGRILVESTEGKGSVFSVALPIP